MQPSAIGWFYKGLEIMGSKLFAVGTKIQWKWYGSQISGDVVEIHLKPISKEIKGKTIKRNGSSENPAYLVRSAAGNFALKLHSELQPLEKDKSKGLKPKMFSD